MAGTAQGQAGPWGSGECAVVADVPADRRGLEWMAVFLPAFSHIPMFSSFSISVCPIS